MRTSPNSLKFIASVLSTALAVMATTICGLATALLGKHRKLMPTAGERLIWGSGDGSTMPVFETPIGNIGAVICWENYMPMLRMAMYAKGISICCAPTAGDADAMLNAILDPLGNVLAGPLFGEETLLSAELDLDTLARAKLDFDVTGHYARPDVFSLTVNEAAQPAVTLKKSMLR